MTEWKPSNKKDQQLAHEQEHEVSDNEKKKDTKKGGPKVKSTVPKGRKGQSNSMETIQSFKERQTHQYNRMKYYMSLKQNAKQEATKEIKLSMREINSEAVMQMKYVDILSRRFEDG